MDLDPGSFTRLGTAIHSAGDAPTAPDDRRLGARARTIFRIVQLVTANDSGLARVCNISDEGLALQTGISLTLEELVHVRFAEDATFACHVAWARGSQCGLRLVKPIDSAALLRAIGARATQPTYRPLRLPVGKAAMSHSELGACRITIRDISLRGMKIEHDGGFRKGLRVKVLLDSGLEAMGIVRWSHEGHAGIMLSQPLSPRELGSAERL